MPDVRTRPWVELAREDFWRSAEPMLAVSPEARPFAEGLARALGEISLSEAISALVTWVEAKRDE